VSVILREPAEGLDLRMRSVWVVQGAITTAVLAVGVVVAVVVLALADAATAAWIVGVAGAGVVIVCAVVMAWLLPVHDHRHFRYEVTELGLYVARGWLWRRWQVVPHARIETVDIRSGPLLRAFGLVAVQVATAAAGGGTGIPGLDPSVADALVEELSRRAGVEERT
jgi:membrane protein YdbS with pleckstrin-like domain